MMKYFFAVILAAVIFLMADGARAQQSYGQLATEVLKLINNHRASKGLRPLVVNATVIPAAEKHSSNMAKGRVPFGHDGFDGRMAQLRKQVKPTTGWAENVAYGSNDAKEIVDMWLHSPGHKKNIEGDYNITGIGIAQGKDGYYYYTQIFLQKD